jgi:dipeptidyl aminopeptidase/acylaminoacyl peptidase
MYACSPVQHAGAAQAPTLIALGAKDRRVPFSQGMEWYHSLKSRGISAKLLCYPEDVHAIGKCELYSTRPLCTQLRSFGCYKLHAVD